MYRIHYQSKNHPIALVVYGILTMVLFSQCQWTNSTDGAVLNAQMSQLSVPAVEVNKESLTLIATEGIYYYQDSPFSGYAVQFYPNDSLAEKISFVEGKKEGLYQKWYPSGILSFESNYKSGRRDGITKTWWKGGGLRSESHHTMGVVHGNQKQWYKSGQLFKSINIVEGKEEGLQQAWRENGKIYNNYEAKNGRIFGLKRANLCFELEDEVVQFSIND